MSRSNHQTYSLHTGRGAAILELAFVLPVLVLVVFGGIEFSRALQRMQIATALSREIASLAYRDPIADPAGDPDKGGKDAQAILDQLNRSAIDVTNLAQKLVPGSEILVSVYRYDPTAPTNTTVDFHSNLPGKYSTRFSWLDRNNGIVGSKIGSQEKRLNTRGYLVVGESYVPYTSILSFVWSMLNQPPQVFYDATVL
jgi:Flp pilus assembly protein TadG